MGGIVETIIVVDEVRVDEKYLADALTRKGIRARLVDIRVEDPRKGNFALIRTSNPYTGLALAQLFDRTINSSNGIFNAVNKVYIYRASGLTFVPLQGEASVEDAVRCVGLPAVLDTAWRLGLDGPVTSVEGIKSVLEYRAYMRNPLAKLSLLVEYYRVVREEFVVGDEVISSFGLDYAVVKYGEVKGKEVVVDVDPVPKLDKRRAELLAEKVHEVLRK